MQNGEDGSKFIRLKNAAKGDVSDMDGTHMVRSDKNKNMFWFCPCWSEIWDMKNHTTSISR